MECDVLQCWELIGLFFRWVWCVILWAGREDKTCFFLLAYLMTEHRSLSLASLVNEIIQRWKRSVNHKSLWSVQSYCHDAIMVISQLRACFHLFCYPNESPICGWWSFSVHVKWCPYKWPDTRQLGIIPVKVLWWHLGRRFLCCNWFSDSFSAWWEMIGFIPYMVMHCLSKQFSSCYSRAAEVRRK